MWKGCGDSSRCESPAEFRYRSGIEPEAGLLDRASTAGGCLDVGWGLCRNIALDLAASGVCGVVPQHRGLTG